MEEIYQRNKARRAAVEATLLLMKECEAHEKEIEDERSKRKFREQAGVCFLVQLMFLSCIY